MNYNQELIESYNKLSYIIENITLKCNPTEDLNFNIDKQEGDKEEGDKEECDKEEKKDTNFNIDNNYNYSLLPITFIKIMSRYIEHYIPNFLQHKMIKNIRFKYKIKVKFTLSNFQTTRLFLEVIFKRNFTKELDQLFDQLKLFGNFIINMNTSYNEIIENICECNKKSNEMIEENIKISENKIKKYKEISEVVYKNTINELNTKIANENSNIIYYDIDQINKLVYSMIENCVNNKINLNAQNLIKNKVIGYINSISDNNIYFKNIEKYEHNNGNSYGTEYENNVFNFLKPILNENGFEILQNIEFEHLDKISGAKLEYDYIIGKIINKKFIILGVFDAKISIALIQSDISKFGKGVQLLMEDKLELRYVFKKKYSYLFNQISSFKDENNKPKIMMGYFCRNYINKDKEISKTIGSYIVSKSYTLFNDINGFKINFKEIKEEMKKDLNKDFQSIINICNKYDTKIYSLL